MKVTVIPIINSALGTISKGAGTIGLRNKRKSRDDPDYSTFEIGQNTKKSPRD